MLGVRHAFDADHIASIDNTTRKLVDEGKSVGEHRLLVLPRALLGRVRRRLLLVVGVRSVAGVVQDGDSAVGQTLGLIGTLVAGRVPGARSA